MKSFILIQLFILATWLYWVNTNKPSKACSDYLLIGRTFEHCITDKRVHE